MKPWGTCREVTHLALQGLDVALPWHARLQMRVHLLICKACPRFMAQLELMQRATRQWRHYTEQAEE